MVGDPVTLINLEGISNNDCSYDLALSNADSGSLESSKIFTLSQAEFINNDSPFVELKEAGEISIFASDIDLVGTYSLELIVTNRQTTSIGTTEEL